MKLNENFNTFGLNKDEILASTTLGKIAYFNKATGILTDIIKIPYVEFIDNTDGYLEIPIAYKNTTNLRNLCIQWGKLTIPRGEAKIINFNKKYVAIYSLQCSCTDGAFAKTSISKRDLNTFEVKHDSEEGVPIFWFSIGQTED